jgi:hypothetical protein
MNTLMKPIGFQAKLRIASMFDRRAGFYIGLSALLLSVVACNFSESPQRTPELPEATKTPIHTASITGMVWHDLCANDTLGEEPPQGCVKDDQIEAYVANGIYESHEEGIADVWIELGSGLCPSEPFTRVKTDADGKFFIEDLQQGAYCLFPSFDGSPLPALVEPGIWTFPKGTNGIERGMQSIYIRAGEQRDEVNFGWDYFNKPASPTAVPTPTATSTPRCIDAAALIRDVSIPDGTLMDPGESFSKIWRMRNTGTCTWTQEYELIFLSGQHMGAYTIVPLRGKVTPGQVVDLSVAMKAPTYPGTYWGYWILRNELGAIFGLGENANAPVWVKILVEPEIKDWRGEYYDNRNLDGDPVLVRNDEEIDFNWKNKGPNSSMPVDDFSVRWTRDLKFDDDDYRFSFYVDDGVRLWVDDRLVLDVWETGPAREVSVVLRMTEGRHTLKVAFFERGGYARISMDIEKISVKADKQWVGTYWYNRTMNSDWALIKSVDTLDFNWGAGSPHPGLPKDEFSIQWKREIDFSAGVYRFYARADDGIRVYVDGERVIDEWHDSNASETYTAELSLSGVHKVMVEYYERAGNAKMALWWEHLGPENQQPVANPDVYETVANELFIVEVPGVLGNDQDPDGDSLTTELVSSPINGMVELNEDGSFTYEPAPSFTGEDVFTYRISDGKLKSNDALVTLTVHPANTPPTAFDDAYEGIVGVSIDIVSPGVLENDVDNEAQDLKAYLESEPDHGSVVLQQDGSFIYKPDASFVGTDQFTYRASDGQMMSNIATVVLSLEALNEPPVAMGDIFEIEMEGLLSVPAPGILANDSDPEGAALQLLLETAPEYGELVLAEDGGFEYIPIAGFMGDDSFSYRVSDGEGISDIAYVLISVLPVVSNS